MGLSGVGKTTLARKLPSNEWFHYSVDYRIWTHYLGDELSDYLKTLAMSHPVLKRLLNADAITVEPRVSFDNLLATYVFMGMLGSPEEGGLTRQEFAFRMAKHAEAERMAMHDTEKFIQRARELYGYPHFFADLSGSLCEIVNPNDPADKVMTDLSKHVNQIVYIRATDEHVAELIRRNTSCPKPIYYRPEFLKKELPGLLEQFGAKDVEEIPPKDVGAYLYPRLVHERISRYEAIAKHYATTIDMDEVRTITGAGDLLARLVLSSQGRGT